MDKNKPYPNGYENYEETTHLCKYCGEPNGSNDEDVLCIECRSEFGHSFFSEL